MDGADAFCASAATTASSNSIERPAPPFFIRVSLRRDVAMLTRIPRPAHSTTGAGKLSKDFARGRQVSRALLLILTGDSGDDPSRPETDGRAAESRSPQKSCPSNVALLVNLGGSRSAR